ncbi:hypothetical protein R2F61_01315 [Mollicutes bacterium LVI A0078]|nr:hypothetical protein RZE84_01315 [Mollicutes bacterium LVI A0075]WOO91217.1 hypothetical protein R2F61_01315 [Mollicutes bacterium LVI A0078]
MVDKLNQSVFFKTINESPKFRNDNIRATIELNPNIVKYLIELYGLSLVKEVYFQGISTKTYNGSKRNKLKKEEIILIKKIEMHGVAKRGLGNLFQNASNYENEFREYFGFSEALEKDAELTRQILIEFYDNYIKEISDDN